jgi:hypothetical protein
MPGPSPLDDPRLAAHAWRRFRRMMKLMAAVTAAAIACAMAFIYSQNGVQSVHLYVATALGIGVAMLLTGALMGLVFLSSGTGHDEAVEDPTPDEWRD